MPLMPVQEDTIRICINGAHQEIPKGTTLESLIAQFRLQKKTVVVEHNRQVADKSTYALMELKENDQVEIVHFVGGG